LRLFSIQHKNIAATLQKYFIARLQHCSNVKISVLKILIRNVAAILQHIIYAILGFAHNGGILAVLLQKHCNNAATLCCIQRYCSIYYKILYYINLNIKK